MELFDEKYETYTDNARQLDSEVVKAIKPIMDRWHKNGCRLVDICHVINDIVSIEACDIRLRILKDNLNKPKE